MEDYTFDFALDLLKEAEKVARKYNQRLTFHLSQYNVVGTPHEDKFQKTIVELEYHADVLNHMGMGKNSIMVVHGEDCMIKKQPKKDGAKIIKDCLKK